MNRPHLVVVDEPAPTVVPQIVLDFLLDSTYGYGQTPDLTTEILDAVVIIDGVSKPFGQLGAPDLIRLAYLELERLFEGF